MDQLKAQDLSTATDEEKHRARQKREKHELALRRCANEERTNVVLTNELAGLLKFPHGASLPGHRITAMASGLAVRFVVGVLIDASGHDYGKLKPIVEKTKQVLGQVDGLVLDKLSVVLDAGFFSSEDVLYAEQNADWLEAVIAPTPQPDAEDRNARPGALRHRRWVQADLPGRP